MKLACLQFTPTLGAVQHNIDRANTLIQSLKPSQLDLLVLPEMCFSGYNFPSLESITPFLEPTTAGPTTAWAVSTAKRLHCAVIAGYPEIHTDETGRTKNYNSTVLVSPNGMVLTNYRKSFLYYTDETWASEGPSGSAQNFSQTHFFKPFYCGPLGRLGKIGHGICMDINPYRFTAPWEEYEFANTMLAEGVNAVVLSMAWLTSLLPHELEIEPEQPDMQTVAYWVERFFPFVREESDVVVVFANRCGMEGKTIGMSRGDGGEEVEEGDRVCYAGSSCVMKFEGGLVRMFERKEGVAIMGKAEEGLLIVDTAQHAKYSLTSKMV